MAGSGGLYARLMTARAFFLARRAQSRLRTRADVARWQERRLRSFLTRVASRVEA